jgi:hypothetical protein
MLIYYPSDNQQFRCDELLLGEDNLRMEVVVVVVVLEMCVRNCVWWRIYFEMAGLCF